MNKKATINTIISFVLILFSYNILQAQILVNEICASNQLSLIDETGDSPDWVELYNPADTSINIEGYYFSDDPLNPAKWIFGNKTIPPKSHLVVFASDKSIHTIENKIDTTNGMSTTYAFWGDELFRPGGSRVEPLDYATILGDNGGHPEYSARIIVADSAGFGWSFAKLFIATNSDSSLANFSDYNSIILKATIPQDDIVRIRIVQDSLEEYLGYHQYIVGTGITNDVYKIPVYHGTKPLNLEKVLGIQFEALYIPDTIEININSIIWTKTDTIGSMPTLHFAYADNMDSPVAGNSTISPYEFSDYLGIKNNKMALSATMTMADNSTPGGLGYSYAGIRMFLHNWDDTINLAPYSKLVLTGYLEADKNIVVRVYHGTTEDWLCYGQTLTGTGIENDTYTIPLHGAVAPLKSNQVRGIGFEGTAPYGPVSFTFTDIQFINDNPEGYIHTNFKLSSQGETIVLYNKDGGKSDHVIYQFIDTDHSFGRATDGSQNWVVFSEPTPNSSNGGESFTGYCSDSLIFSIDAGFYNGNQSLTISGSSEIRYTIDGSLPDKNSLLYQSSISIDSTLVINAACFVNNTLPKTSVSNTYFINEKHTLPVFSIITDPDHFFDWESGLFMDGPNWTAPLPHLGANYWEDWEKPVHIEFYDKNGVLCLEQNAGIKIFGGWSRTNPMKSIRLKAKKQYGEEQFKYKFFEQKNNENFRQIVLRNSGNDFNMLHFHDAINHTVASKSTDIDYLGYQPALVYINGQYWGIQNIREKINEYYINNNHGIALDSIQLMDTWGGMIVGKGDEKLNTLYENIMTNDMSDDANFTAFGASSFDIDNFIDFFVINTFSSNWDWPQNNLKFWKPASLEGKIRYIMYDTDITYGKYGMQAPHFNQLQRLMNSSEIGPHAEIFTAFLDNEGFRNKFINRSADLMNTTLSSNYLLNTIDSLQAGIALEMPRHKEKWGGTMQEWQEDIDTVKSWINQRHFSAFHQIQDEFGLPSQVELTLKVIPENAGTIKLNSIYPETYPWTGTYFNGVPVTLTIIPNPGFSFEYWETSNAFPYKESQKKFSLNFSSDDTITAIFTGNPIEEDILVSEINYHSHQGFDAGDWFELYNNGNSALDISNWYLMDEKDYGRFEFPYGTILQANQRLLLIHDTIKFESIYDTLTYSFFSIDFGLDNSGDQIRLFNFNGNPKFTLRYNDNNGWPIEADGQGYTLELKNEGGNPNDPSSWISGCLLGSPAHAYSDNCATNSEQNEETIIHQEIVVFPNPAIEEITVQHNFATGHIQIFDYTGKLVFATQVEADSQTLNIEHLNIGMYILSISSDEDRRQEIFIKH